MSESYDLGILGEENAWKYLEKQGHQLLHKRWHYGSYEIDLVTLHNNTLHSTEVKTRQFNTLINPLEAINPKKQKRLIEATHAYATQHNIDLDIQFNIIIVTQQNTNFSIEYIEDAFKPWG